MSAGNRDSLKFEETKNKIPSAAKQSAFGNACQNEHLVINIDGDTSEEELGGKQMITAENDEEYI